MGFRQHLTAEQTYERSGKASCWHLNVIVVERNVEIHRAALDDAGCDDGVDVASIMALWDIDEYTGLC